MRDEQADEVVVEPDAVDELQHGDAEDDRGHHKGRGEEAEQEAAAGEAVAHEAVGREEGKRCCQ